jgi:hypothetical protein
MLDVRLMPCARSRTANTAVSGERKARDSNPHSPGGNRVSSAARPTVSGYLPVKSIREVVDHRGVEPRSPGCKPGVFPLDQQPVSVDHRQRSARESNSVPLLTRKGCRRRTRGPSCFILMCPGWDSNPQAPEFKPGRSTDWRTWARRRKRYQFRGPESNQRPPRSERGVTTNSNCPGVVISGRRIRTSTA